MINDNDNINLCELSASEVISLLKRREVSPLELVEASADRIQLTDGHINAIPTRCFDRARQHAKKIMENSNRHQTDNPAWLGGLPISVKDLVAVKGVRTTWGSPIFSSHIPSKSDILVEILESNGAIVIGKSNTPEIDQYDDHPNVEFAWGIGGDDKMNSSSWILHGYFERQKKLLGI